MESTSAILRRRNGSQQACEPCRKGKIACDHALPVCGRCRRRKTFSQCQYVNAPMSKSHNGSGRLARSNSATASPKAPLPSPAISSVSLGSKHDHAKPISGPFNKAAGVFGSTSFSAIFMENQSTFPTNFPDTQESNIADGTISPANEELVSHAKGSLRMERAMRALQKFPDRKTFDYLMAWAERIPYTSLHDPSVQRAGASIWASFGTTFKEPRRPTNLEDFAQVLFGNGESALEEPEDYESWIAAWTGPKLRWEVMGIIFNRLGIAALSMSDDDPLFTSQQGTRIDKRQFGSDMKDCAQTCCDLMCHGDMINPLMAGCLLLTINCQTMISGDASLIVWRKIGDLASTATALGLYLEEDSMRPTSIVSEMRKRLWAGIFNVDKSFAAFNGRPPCLSHRYARCPLPLDLSDETLMLPLEDIAREVEKLRPGGWGTQNKFFTATISRANYLFNLMLDETLEISLGTEQQVSIDRIQSVQSRIRELSNWIHRSLVARLDETYANLPPFAQFKKTESIGMTDQFNWIRQYVMRMNYLRIQFLLHRLSIKHCNAGTQALVDCAQELLELAVFLWVHRDRFVTFHSDLDFMFICYGIPASGVLCLELLKGLQTPPQPQARMPRSDVVQNLSMLIGFLDWVRPTAANYALCIRMRKIIKHVLDQILNPPVHSQQPDPRTFLYNELGNEFGSIDYLDNFDWLDTRLDWMPMDNSLSVHALLYTTDIWDLALLMEIIDGALMLTTVTTTVYISTGLSSYLVTVSQSGSVPGTVVYGYPASYRTTTSFLSSDETGYISTQVTASETLQGVIVYGTPVSYRTTTTYLSEGQSPYLSTAVVASGTQQGVIVVASPVSYTTTTTYLPAGQSSYLSTTRFASESVQGVVIQGYPESYTTVTTFLSLDASGYTSTAAVASQMSQGTVVIGTPVQVVTITTFLSVGASPYLSTSVTASGTRQGTVYDGRPLSITTTTTFLDPTETPYTSTVYNASGTAQGTVVIGRQLSFTTTTTFLEPGESSYRSTLTSASGTQEGYVVEGYAKSISTITSFLGLGESSYISTVYSPSGTVPGTAVYGIAISITTVTSYVGVGGSSYLSTVVTPSGTMQGIVVYGKPEQVVTSTTFLSSGFSRYSTYIPPSGTVDGTLVIGYPLMYATTTSYLAPGQSAYTSTATASGTQEGTIFVGVVQTITYVTTYIPQGNSAYTSSLTATGSVQTVVIGVQEGITTVTSYLPPDQTSYLSSQPGTDSVQTVVVGQPQTYSTSTVYVGASGSEYESTYAAGATGPAVPVVAGRRQLYVTSTTYLQPGASGYASTQGTTGSVVVVILGTTQMETTVTTTLDPNSAGYTSTISGSGSFVTVIVATPSSYIVSPTLSFHHVLRRQPLRQLDMPASKRHRYPPIHPYQLYDLNIRIHT